MLSTFTRRQYEHDLEVLDRIAGSEFNFTAKKSGTELAKEAGQRIARELLEGFDVEYRVVGAIVDDRLGKRIVSEAGDRGCDHVFLTSKRQSRIGGVLGDAARRVLREHDGLTTVAYERDPERRLLRLRGGSVENYEFRWSGE